MDTISNRIQYAMDKLDLKQTDLVSRTGISKGALSSYISGRYVPKQNNIYLIAKALNVSEAWLMGADVPMSRNVKSKNGITINVLGRVAAGIPINAITEIIDTEEISEEMAKTGEYFGLKIRGDSMEPRICDGDVVIVRQQDDAESGDIVIAMVNGDDATCKRLVKYASSIALVSLNSKYEPMMFTNEEIMSKPVRVIGKVVELRGKF
ncbi:MAG: helix-turn-helix domain-containing protein [Lachnospiraceae bacterium]|nr:helix-turn-helix domain-containing protein [Lachnospiraceae bacterium]